MFCQSVLLPLSYVKSNTCSYLKQMVMVLHVDQAVYMSYHLCVYIYIYVHIEPC